MRVLIVEDEVLIRQDVADYLRAYGWDVDEAGNGRMALDCMHRAIPDVILLDLRMPVMNGYEFNAERVRDPALACVPLILMSGNINEASARTLGALAALDKPVEKKKLLALLAEVKAGLA
jgi:CheY-like chemotaxis protein